jgi:hypothetical protein
MLKIKLNSQTYVSLNQRRNSYRRDKAVTNKRENNKINTINNTSIYTLKSTMRLERMHIIQFTKINKIACVK